MLVLGKKLLLHGGQTLSSYSVSLRGETVALFDSLHEYNVESKTWTLVHTKNQGPKVSGHSLFLLNNKSLICFGGLTLADPGNSNLVIPSNEVWSFHLENLTWNLVRRHNPSVVPPPRFGHSMVRLDESNGNGSSCFLILGGCGENRVFLNDVWLLRIMSSDSCMWTPIIIRPHPDTSYPFGPQIHLNPVCKVSPTSLLILNSRKRGQERGNLVFPSSSSSRTLSSNLVINVLDVQSVRTLGFVRWRSSTVRASTAIEDIALYSLVLGKNEIIMFGGASLPEDMASPPASVANDLFFISAHKTVT